MIIDESFRKKAIEIANEQIRELRKTDRHRGAKSSKLNEPKKTLALAAK